MPFPIIPVLASAAAGIGLYEGYKHWVQPRLEAAKAPAAGPLPGTVSELTKGVTYAVQVALAAGQPGGGTQRFTDPGAAGEFIKNFFQSVGFALGDSIPALRDKEAADAFQAGLTSTWIFTATWTRPEKVVTQGSPMIGMALFTPLPIKAAA